MSTDKRGQTWTPEDEKQVVALLREGKDLEHIAAALGRTEGAIVGRMEQMMYQRQKFLQAKKVLLSDV